jgi:nitroreductase
MEIYEAMSTMRAVRRLRPDPVPDDVLNRVLTAATWAPSGGNRQGWHIVVVRDPQTKQTLQELYHPIWQAYAASYDDALLADLPEDAQRKATRTLASGTYLSENLHAVPVVAVFCFNPEFMSITDAALDRPSVVGGASVYPAVQNLLLACRNEGLGCVLTTLLCLEEPRVRELLSIPDGWYTCAHVPIGYPVGGGHGPISRKPVAEMVSWDRFQGG